MSANKVIIINTFKFYYWITLKKKVELNLENFCKDNDVLSY